jgi:uncharacterized protein (TIRG00374 family)
VTVGLLAWALRGVPASAVWTAVRQAEFGWLGLGGLAFVLSFAVRAQRWGTLLAGQGEKGGFSIRHAAIYIGFAGNCLLPASAGELARAAALQRFGRVPFGTAVGSILAERLLDAVVVFVFLITPLLAGVVSGAGLGVLRLEWMAIALVVVSVLFVAAAASPERITRLAEGTLSLLGFRRAARKLGHAVGSLLAGLDALRRPGRAGRAMAETIVIWLLTGLTYWFALIAFGVSSPGYVGALFIQSVAALGIALPSTPGYFGPYEAALRLGLDAFAVSPHVIVAYALTVHLLIYVTVVTVGLVVAVRLGLSWSDLRRPGPNAPAMAGGSAS